MTPEQGHKMDCKCKDCKSVDVILSSTAGLETKYVCHKNPPQLLSFNAFQFPVVGANDWCDQFIPKELPKDAPKTEQKTQTVNKLKINK